MNETIALSKYILSLKKDNCQWEDSSPIYNSVKNSNEYLIGSETHLLEAETRQPEAETRQSRRTKEVFFTNEYGDECLLETGKSGIESSSEECEIEVCCPFSLKFNENYGRHLIALKDITAGEIVMNERPAVIAPLVNSKTAKEKLPCISCFKEAKNILCRQCGFFVCGDECLSAHDKNECDTLKHLNLTESQQHIYRIKSKEFLDRVKKMSDEEQKYTLRMMKETTELFFQSERGKLLKYYPILAVLRTLLLMKKFPNIENVISSMQGFLDETKSQYKVNQEVIVNPIAENLQLHYSTDFIHTVASVWDTNAFEAKLSSRVYCQGLYIAAALWTHSCFPNCEQSFTSDGTMILRAIEDIPKGSLLTICYTDPLWPTYIRKNHLRRTKGFNCTCCRCSDPSEFDTFLGSILCQKCHDFFMPFPETEEDQKKIRRRSEEDSHLKVFCRNCPNFFYTKDLIQGEVLVTKMLKKFPLKTIQEIRQIKESLPLEFHDSHHLVFRMNVNFISAISSQNAEEMERAEMEGADMERADMARAEMEGADMEGADMERADLLEMSRWIRAVYVTSCKLLPRFSLLRAKLGRGWIIRWQQDKMNMINPSPEVSQDWKLLIDDVTTVLGWHGQSL